MTMEVILGMNEHFSKNFSENVWKSFKNKTKEKCVKKHAI